MKLERPVQPGTGTAARAARRRLELPPAARLRWPGHHAAAPGTAATAVWQGSRKGHLPTCFVAGRTGAAPTARPAGKLVRVQNDASKQGDLLEQLPFFSNTTVASQLLLSSISVLFAKPLTIFAEFFVFLSKQ